MKTEKNQGVVFLCFSKDRELFLALRGPASRDFNGYWDPGSGRVEPGELPDQALLRELKEEYGVNPLKFSLVDQLDSDNWLHYYYLVAVNREDVNIKEPHKLVEGQWYAPDALPSPTHPTLRTLLVKHSSSIDELLNQ